jgi:hypothetical protein
MYFSYFNHILTYEIAFEQSQKAVTFTRTSMFACTMLSAGIGCLGLFRYLLDFADEETAVQSPTDEGVAMLEDLDVTLIATIAGAGLAGLGGICTIFGSMRRNYCNLALGISLMLLGCSVVVSN